MFLWMLPVNLHQLCSLASPVATIPFPHHRVLNPWMYEGKKWSQLVPAGSRETEWSYEFPSYYDYHARGALYYAIITSVKTTVQRLFMSIWLRHPTANGSMATRTTNSLCHPMYQSRTSGQSRRMI
jgi:hypothetical protein